MAVDEIALRRCSVDDAETLALVGSATFLEAFAGRLEGSAILAHCARVYTPAASAELLAKPTTHAWFATVEPEEAPVGFFVLSEPDLPLNGLTDADIELKRIYLFSRFRGKGRGQQMMDQAIRGARELGKTRLLLGVYTGNEHALDFYARNGFQQVGTRSFQVGNLIHDDLILGLAL